MAQHTLAYSALLPKIPCKRWSRTALVTGDLRLYLGSRLLKADRFQKSRYGRFIDLRVCENQCIYHLAVAACRIEDRNAFFPVLFKWCEAAGQLPILSILRRKHLRGG